MDRREADPGDERAEQPEEAVAVNRLEDGIMGANRDRGKREDESRLEARE